MHAVVAGATGLVGQALLAELVRQGIPTTALARRVGTAPATWRRTDLAALGPGDVPPTATMAFCALGTTIKAAGSQDAFRAVDHGMVLSFARACHAAGINTFAVVSAAGANPRSRVFYSRVKGEMERDLQAVGFGSLTILRPGLLIGDRTEPRPMERLAIVVTRALRPLLPGAARGVSSQAVSRALLASTRQATPGVHVLDNAAIQKLGA